jgi:hypothetical protein
VTVITLRQYRRFLLHVARWWALAAFAVGAVLVACILVDWLGYADWGYPWWSLLFVIGFIAFAIGVRKGASILLKL